MFIQTCCSFRDFDGLLFKDRNIEKVDGYFQNFRYFHPNSEKNVKKLFTFVDPIRKMVSSYCKACQWSALAYPIKEQLICCFQVDEFLENVGISLTVRSARMIETNVANDDQAFEMPEADGKRRPFVFVSRPLN